MPVDLKALKAHKVSSRDYKKIFSQPAEKYPPKIRDLVNLISARIRDGRDMNLSEWKAYHAVDLAYDVPFNQTTPTLIHNIISKKLDQAATKKALEDLGLSEDELFLKITAPNGQVGYKFNAPVFYQIYIPLVKAYCTIRLAKLFNERNVEPFLEYKPNKDLDTDRVMCEIVTDVASTISRWLGYPAVLRQAILQVLKYGNVIAFPREEWYCEKQLATDDAGLEQVVTVKEGLRYVLPHPTRMACDLRFPATTLNSDSGCEWALFWHVVSYGEVLDNPMYWNRKQIFAGTNWFQAPLAGNYFTEVYPCNIKFPVNGFGSTNREDKAAWYGTGDRDKAVFMTEVFMKLIPSVWGLADYKYPVWHRFTVAGDDSIVWAAPCAYNPTWFMGYDYDENAGRNPSMALEAIPWQDHVGNILSQMILTARQNLTSIIFYDNQQIQKADVEELKNMGEEKYRSAVWMGYDSLKNRALGLNQGQAFSSPNLPKGNVTELQQLLPQVLSIMERVLQVSAQEAGAQATHQQSKFELEQVGGGTSNRAALTGSYVDEGIDAWMIQLYDASKAYMDATVVAQVSADIPNVEDILKQMGFKVVRKGEEKLRVQGRKTAIRLEGFARRAEGTPKANDKETAQALFQVVNVVASQEELRGKVGARNIMSLVELAASFAGAPRGFRLREAQDGKDGQITPEMMKALQQVQQTIMQAVSEKVAKPAAEEVAKLQGEIQQMQQALQQLEGIYKVASAANDKLKLEQERTQQQIALKQQEAQADQARKNAEMEAEQRRKDAELQADLQRKEQETQAKIENDRKVAAAKAEAAAKAKPSGGEKA